MKEAILSNIQKDFKKSCYSNFKKIVEKYSLIVDEDRIAVELAEDKNNLLLISCLIEYVKERDGKVKLEYFVIEKENKIPEHLIELFNITAYTVVKETQIDRIYTIIGNKECTKLALPHNYNDIVNSTFMTLIERKEVAKIEPKRYSEKAKNLQFIRPLCLIEDATVKSFIKFANMSWKEEVSVFSRLAFLEEQVVIPTYESEKRYEFNIYQRV